MATMKQVAERAGVSTSTVSHVINNTRAVSEDVRTRVQAVIEEMRYIPSAVARSLKNDKTYTIGVSVPDNTHPGIAELLRGIEDAAFAVGYNIMLCNGHEDAQRQAAHLRGLIEKRIDGLVLVGGSTSRQLRRGNPTSSWRTTRCPASTPISSAWTTRRQDMRPRAT